MGNDTFKLAIFSAQQYDRETLSPTVGEYNSNRAAETPKIELSFHSLPLTVDTAVAAADHDAVCVFVQDNVSRDVLTKLVNDHGIRCVLLRCAGFNHVDLDAAHELGVRVARVPAYSPESVAEFAVTLMLTLNRKVHRAYNRVRENNFALNGLMGFTIHNCTVGIVGTGKIGVCTARILRGFGCKILAYDPFSKSDEMVNELGAEYVDLSTLLSRSDIVSLHCPLIEKSDSSAGTRHLINAETLKTMKPGAMLINTSRGALLNTKDVIGALKSRHLGSLGLDVYEDEGPLFFQDLSGVVLQDDVFGRLTSFTNVIVCGHQGFFTKESLMEIAQATIDNVCWYAKVRSGKEDGDKEQNNVVV